jgi:hypothetical protein
MGALTQRLESAGFALRLDGDELVITPTVRPLTDVQRDWVKANKPVLIAELRAQEPAKPTPQPQPAPQPTPHPPMLTIGELLNILDGDPTVVEASRRLGERLNQPRLRAWPWRNPPPPLSDRARELVRQGWAEPNARARAESEAAQQAQGGVQ